MTEFSTNESISEHDKYKCEKCGQYSIKVNGRISCKSDKQHPQPEGYGCDCENATFLKVTHHKWTDKKGNSNGFIQ